MEERFERFTTLMSNINRSIRKIKTEGMAQFHLKGLHVLCLYHLYKQTSLTATDLCALCEEDKANVSRAIEYLEINDYLYCDNRVQGQKRYRNPLKLTEKGMEAGAHIAKEVECILDKASSGISEEHRQILYDCLDLINTNLQKTRIEYAVKQGSTPVSSNAVDKNTKKHSGREGERNGKTIC